VLPEDSGLPLETVFLGFQVRSLDAKRFPDAPAGKLSNEKMIEVENAVRYQQFQIQNLTALKPLQQLGFMILNISTDR